MGIIKNSKLINNMDIREIDFGKRKARWILPENFRESIWWQSLSESKRARIKKELLNNNMELEKLRARMNEIDSNWNGDNPGLGEERASIAKEVIRKINDIEELLKLL
jgi:hypothetical protein